MPAHDSEYEALARDYERLMSSVIRRVCGPQLSDLVPDVQQEVRVALWRQLKGGKKIEYPASYLYKMALTTALRLVKKHRRSDASQLGDLPGLAPSGPRDMREAEQSRLLDEILEQLDPDADRAIRGYLAGFTHKEVAELFGWSESRARHLIYRTIERLRSKFESAGVQTP